MSGAWQRLVCRVRYGVRARQDWTGGTVLTTRRALTRVQVEKIRKAWRA